jgi:hypothetical protein
MSVKELIQQAVQKDASNFEAKFNDIMADRVTAAIETKYASMFSPTSEVEVETDAQSETEE